MLTYVGCFEHLKYLSKYLTIIFYKNFSNSLEYQYLQRYANTKSYRIFPI